MTDYKRMIKRWEKYIMIAEIVVDRHCIKNPDDTDMLSARAYLHTIRRQIRKYLGFAQSTLPTILDFARRSPKERVRYLSKNWGGYLKRVSWLKEPKEAPTPDTPIADYLTDSAKEDQT